jgi:hypothetical protein
MANSSSSRFVLCGGCYRSLKVFLHDTGGGVKTTPRGDNPLIINDGTGGRTRTDTPCGTRF